MSSYVDPDLPERANPFACSYYLTLSLLFAAHTQILQLFLLLDNSSPLPTLVSSSDSSLSPSMLTQGAQNLCQGPRIFLHPSLSVKPYELYDLKLFTGFPGTLQELPVTGAPNGLERPWSTALKLGLVLGIFSGQGRGLGLLVCGLGRTYATSATTAISQHLSQQRFRLLPHGHQQLVPRYLIVTRKERLPPGGAWDGDGHGEGRWDHQGLGRRVPLWGSMCGWVWAYEELGAGQGDSEMQHKVEHTALGLRRPGLQSQLGHNDLGALGQATPHFPASSGFSSCRSKAV